MPAGAPATSRSTWAAHASIARRMPSSKLVFLIDADDAAETSADVVEASLDHVQIDAELRHAAGDASTNIVKPKLSERGRALRFDKLGDCVIETKLGLRKPRYGSDALAAAALETLALVVFNARQGLQNAYCQRRQRQACRPLVFPRAAGSDQSFFSKSTSAHRIPTTSPRRAPVGAEA